MFSMLFFSDKAHVTLAYYVSSLRLRRVNTETRQIDDEAHGSKDIMEYV